jgi:NAD-dependent SIR2 family protein deacetylase
MTTTKQHEAVTIPRDARTLDAITELSHDNVCQGNYSIMIDPAVIWFSEQARGEERRQFIEIPRKAFDAFVEWYTTGKIPPGDKAWR